MKITKAHQIKLNPTPEQEQYFWQAAGIARYAFNWGLARYNEILDYNREHPDQKQRVNGRLLKKEFNQVKPDWVSGVTCWAYQGAFDDLQSAFRMFWDKSKKGLIPKAKKPRKDGRPNGWPRFKSRNRSMPTFYLANTVFKFDGHLVQFDKGRVGWVNMAEPLRFEGKVLGGRVTYQHGRWWLSVQVEYEIEELVPSPDIVGVDLGIKYLAVTSDGEVFHNPKAFQKVQRKLKRLQRKLDRQRRANNPDNFNLDGTVKNGPKTWVKSANMIKTEQAIQRLHYRVACIRNEASHTMTTSIAQNYGVIGIEDLNIKGVQQNGRLSKAISDAALYEKRRQLEYKAGWNGGIVVPVSRWFPSSKTCNNCGWINGELRLSDREWTCQECGQVNHRDGNAALNIRDEAVRILTGSSPDYSDGDIKRLNVNSDDSLIVEEPQNVE